MQADVLSPWLELMPVTGRIDTRCHFGAPWRLAPGPAGQLEVPFHVLLQGEAILEVPGAPPVTLQAGDVVLLPHGDAHTMHDGSGRRPRGSVERASSVVNVLENRSRGSPTDILCGRFMLRSFSEPMARRYLPASLVVKSREAAGEDAQGLSRHASRLQGLIALLRAEAQDEGPGSAALIGHLCGALFSLALRCASETDAAKHTLLALAQRPSLQPALMAMFTAPEKPWTLPALAALCHMSRATLIRQFEAATGHSPAELLLQIRMARAMQRLQHSEQSSAAIADDVGYQSEAAFQRAFKRHTGITPARFRQSQRQGARGG